MSAVETQNQYVKQDATKQYPGPKFEEQTQSAPGLAQETGQPADSAPIYVLLASQESSYVTGETYGVTGGNTLP